MRGSMNQSMYNLFDYVVFMGYVFSLSFYGQGEDTEVKLGSIKDLDIDRTKRTLMKRESPKYTDF